jgi:hypothetical protein
LFFCLLIEQDRFHLAALHACPTPGARFGVEPGKVIAGSKINGPRHRLDHFQSPAAAIAACTYHMRFLYACRHQYQAVFFVPVKDLDGFVL